MKKTLITIGLIIAGATGVLYFGKAPEKKKLATERQPLPVVNEYPHMKLVMTDGSFRTTRELPDKSILIIYFPDCDHCQREAKEISSHLKAFSNYHVWFVSTASYKEIEWFAKEFKLIGQANIHFVRTETADVVNNFGAIPTPSVYIFSDGGKFVKAFNGETKIEEIIKFL